MNVDGSKVVQLTRDDADHEDPAWCVAKDYSADCEVLIARLEP